MDCPPFTTSPTRPFASPNVRQGEVANRHAPLTLNTSPKPRPANSKAHPVESSSKAWPGCLLAYPVTLHKRVFMQRTPVPGQRLWELIGCVGLA